MIENRIPGFGSRRFCLLVLAILIFYCEPALAQPVISLKYSDTKIPLGPYAQYYRDSTGNFTLDDIRSLGESAWSTFGKGSANFRYTNDAVWIRFRIKDDSGGSSWILESAFPILDRISLYRPDRNGSYVSTETGRLLPYSHREIDNKKFLFNLQRVDDTRPYYVRIQSHSTLICDLTIWRPEHLTGMFDHERLFSGIFYGIMLIMVLYNFSIFLAVRDETYLYYSLYQTFAALFFFTLEGYASQYLFPNTPVLGKHSHLIFGGLGHLSGYVFALKFLKLKDTFPAGRWMIFLMTVPSLIQISSPIVGYHMAARTAQVSNIIGPAVIITCGAVCLARGYKPARFLLLAWIAPLAAIIIYALARFNIVPFSFITEHGPQIGIAVEAWLLSLALADRINIMHREIEEQNSREMLHNAALAQARSIQQSLLPASAPSITGLNVESAFFPMEDVGGDLYEFRELPDGEFMIFVGDVSGHGIPAALLAATAKTLLYLFGEKRPSPGMFLRYMNEILVGRTAGNFLSCELAIISPDRKKLTMASGGHPPMLHIRNGNISQVKGKGVVIGLFPVAEFEEVSIDLEQGDRLLFITDGLLGMQNSGGEYFENTVLVEVCRDAGGARLKDFIALLVGASEKFKIQAADRDDITIVAVEVA